MADQNRGQVKRPLSPHLQVYRWRIHMLTSIVHRATGSALAGGAVLLVWWLVALASGEEYFRTVQGYAGSPFGQLVLFGLTFAMFQHLASGIRHLLMDTGALYELAANKLSATLTYVFSSAATGLLWAYILFGGGA